MRSLPGLGTEAELIWWNAPSGRLELAVPGLHNVRNALAALAVGDLVRRAAGRCPGRAADYRGSARRFEWKGEVSEITVIDDYAHHPTEIEATLAAARRRYPDRRIWAIFQPHTFSRTRHMLYRMGDSFDAADRVIVTDIYAAREVDDGSVHARELVAASSHTAIQYIGDLRAVADYLAEQTAPGDVVITLGAGDGYQVGEWLLDALRRGGG